jgi:hypothetical protein
MHSERFHETQRFRQRWVWAVIIASIALAVLITGFGVWQQVVRGVPFGDEPTSNTGLLFAFGLTVAIGLGVILLIKASQLDVAVRDDEIFIRFRPFHLNGRHIALRDVADAKMRVYRPILEYGGWGIRMGFSGMAYNVSGNEGVQLVLADGSRVLIGSQRSRELEAAITSSRNRAR